MKCPEAAACMHRYLDGELSHVEESEFLLHINDCSDCYEEFDLLQRLSNDLYQLPEVTPRFSLVDSILPRLEAIELAKEHAVHQESKHKPSEEITSIPQRPTQRKVARWQRYGGMGGAVAAAILIIGFFMFQHNPQSFPSADSPAPASIDSSKSETATMFDGTESSIPSTPESTRQSAPQTKEDKSSKGSPTSTLNAQDAAPTSEKKKVANESKNRSSASVQQEPEQQALPTPNPSAPSSTSKKTKAVEENNTKKIASVTAPNKDPKIDEHESKSTMSPAGTGALEDTAPEMLKPETPITAPLDSDSLHSITSQRSLPNEWVSADGQYTVILDKNHVMMYMNSSQDSTLISDQELEGSWIQGTWSEDSKVFNYKTSDQENLKEHSIKVDEIEVK